MAITIKCTNYECKFRNDNTKLCTLETVNMATNHWNRHGVCCNSCEYGDKVKKSYYTPEWLEIEESFKK